MSDKEDTRGPVHFINEKKIPNLLFFGQFGSFPDNFENAEDFAKRLARELPEQFHSKFSDHESAVRILRSEIKDLAEGCNQIMNHIAPRQPRPAGGYLITSVSETTGVKVSSQDRGEDWMRRVEKMFPGYLGFVAPTEKERREVLNRSMTIFHGEVAKSKILLIANLLFMVLSAILFILATSYGMADISYEKAKFLFKIYIGACVVSTLMIVPMRTFLMKFEANPSII